jgi:hypothetical protein
MKNVNPYFMKVFVMRHFAGKRGYFMKNFVDIWPLIW